MKDMSAEYYFSLDRMTHFLQYANALQEGDSTLWSITKDQTTEIFLQHIRSFIETCGVEAFKNIQVTHKKSQITEPPVIKDPPVTNTNVASEPLENPSTQQKSIIRKPLPATTQAKFDGQQSPKREKHSYPIYERLRIIQVTGVEGTYPLADVLSKSYNIRHVTVGLGRQIAHLFKLRYKREPEKTVYYPPKENPTIKTVVYTYPTEEYERWIDGYIIMHCITPHFNANESLRSLTYIRKFEKRNTSENKLTVEYFSNPRHKLTFEHLKYNYSNFPYSINTNLL